MTTAVQLSLVRLLRSWKVLPTAVTGHSSGEVSAAFAAGAIDFREGLAIVYFRGVLTTQYLERTSIQGGMLAVGLGRDEVEPYLKSKLSGKVGIACVNSPSSVTLSGDLKAVEELESTFTEKKLFARRVKVEAAYHSHHMQPFAKDYELALKKNLKQDGKFENVLFSSPVTGQPVDSGQDLGPQHWVKNMVQPVLFEQSLRAMCASESSSEEGSAKQVDTIIEIGPHSALAGPIRQTLSLPQMKDLGISYSSCLTRGKNAVETMQSLACFLKQVGYPVDLKEVNFPQNRAGLEVLHDLPPYPWNHSVSHWVESRLNHEYRQRKEAPHDLLGTLVYGANPMEPTWRHFIRPEDMPWVRDHCIESEMIYPGAGCIAMAIEAFRQFSAQTEREPDAYELRDIQIMTALVIPDTSSGVETQITLKPCSEKSLEQDWFEFNIYSGGVKLLWQKHCSGLISGRFSAITKKSPEWVVNSQNLAEASTPSSETSTYTKKVDVEDFFQGLRDLNINHGPIFQNLLSVRSAPGKSLAVFEVADSASVMPKNWESKHVLHPITLDALFQAAYSVLSKSQATHLGAAIPRTIRSMTVSAAISTQPKHHFQVFSTLKECTPAGFDVSIKTTDEQQGSPTLIEIDGFHYQSIGSSLGQLQQSDAPKLCYTVQWEQDLTLNESKDLKASLINLIDSSETAFVEDLKKATIYIINDALSSITDSDIEKMDWHFKLFIEWMKVQRDLASRNDLAHNSARWLKVSQGVKQMFLDKVAARSMNGKMICLIGQNLVGILKNEVAPLQLMLQDKLLYSYYEKARGTQRALGQVEKLVNIFARHNPRGKILEIGGGTGAATVPALKALGGGDSKNPPRFSRYRFTDISAGFFETAREKFSAWGDLIDYAKLDIEQDLAEQSFEEGTYDLIIACQVLHATKSIVDTMKNVRRLLKPGTGKLIMVETTQDAVDVQLVFGTLPGWWLSKEPERKYSPNMPLSMWERVLSESGFSGLDFEVHDSEDPDNYLMSVIMTTAKVESPPSLPQSTSIVYSGAPPPSDWLATLSRSISDVTSTTTKVESLDGLDASGKICIFVSEIDEPLLDNMSSSSFDAVKSLLNNADGVLWLSRGATVLAERPQTAVHTGLLRTLRLENAGKKYFSLDLDPKGTAWSEASIGSIVKIFARVFNEVDFDTFDFEYTERDSQIYVPRIFENPNQNEAVAQQATKPEAKLEPFHQPERELRLDVGTPGLLDSLAFKDDPSAGEPLPDDFVEIEPKAFGLNFRDIMVAMGQLQEKIMGFECAGIVTRLGPNPTHKLKLGDRVCALTTRGHWANFIRIHWTGAGKIPDEMDFEQAATIPMVFVTAYYSLCETARLRKGETVLIHAGTGGVGQAAIILAQHLEADIYVTVGSKEKRDFVCQTYGIAEDHIFSSRDVSFAANIMAATNGRGVDVVLNSLSGELLNESWKVVATCGRFVEIGKRDIQQNKNLAMEHFGRAISFSAVDLIHLGNEKGLVMAEVMEIVLRLMAEKKIRPVSPITSFPISKIKNAFRLMQAGKHMGKIIIKPNEGDLVPVSFIHGNAQCAGSDYQIRLFPEIVQPNCPPTHPT